MFGYGTNDGLTTWLSENGYALPVAALSPAVLRQRGSTYIDAIYGARFVGFPTGGIDQERAWPRTGATVFDQALASDLVPNRVVLASYQAAWMEAQDPGSLSVIVSEAERIKRMEAGSAKLEYFDGTAMPAVEAATQISSEIEGLLAPLLVPDFVEPSIMVI